MTDVCFFQRFVVNQAPGGTIMSHGRPVEVRTRPQHLRHCDAAGRVRVPKFFQTMQHVAVHMTMMPAYLVQRSTTCSGTKAAS